MPRYPRVIRATSMVWLISAIATSAIHGQVMVPIHTLGAPEAATTRIFKSASVRTLSDGRVLVNDRWSRQVLMYDRSLSLLSVVLDSAAGVPNSYGRVATELLAYRGDSSLFVDRTARAFVLLDPAGVKRANAVIPGDLIYRSAGGTGYSPGLGFVYSTLIIGHPPRRPAPGSPAITAIVTDSNVVIAYDLATHTSDTLALFSVGSPRVWRVPATGDITAERMNPNLRPLAARDDWAVMADGSVAIVRGRDYRIDWIDPDRTRSSTPPVAHVWTVYSSADKVRMADSLARLTQRDDSMSLVLWIADSSRSKQPFFPASLPPRPSPSTRVLPADIPDSLPALQLERSVFGDADDNLWVRTQPPIGQSATGDVFDVINRKGVLIDRVRIPPRTQIVGFAPGGVVYTAQGVINPGPIERYRRR